MGIYGSIVRVCGFNRNGLQVGLFGCPQVVPGSPQEAGILAKSLGVLGLHFHRPLEVVLSSVKISNTFMSILGIKTKASTCIVRKKKPYHTFHFQSYKKTLAKLLQNDTLGFHQNICSLDKYYNMYGITRGGKKLEGVHYYIDNIKCPLRYRNRVT